MSDLTPITREEMLLSGDDLTPITRKEQYIRHLYDETQVIPSKPVTREEMFLLKAGEELHDVTIEQLSVTENGTYSETGKAYSPVIVEVPEPTLISKSITDNGTYNASDDSADGYSSVSVNVPLPSNAYLLKDIPNLPADIATFNDGQALPMPQLKVGIEPVQDLHGYDNPWVGGSGKNKFDATLMTNPTANVQWLQITLSANTQYTMSSSIPYSTASAYIFCIGGTDTSSATSANSGVGLNTPRTVTSDNNGIISVGYRNVGADGTLDLTNYTYQIESGSTATSYAPYSNICPISGWDEANVTDCGKNLFDYTNISAQNVGSIGERNGAIFKKSGTYSISAVNSGSYMYARIFNSDGSIKSTYNVVVSTTITPATFTISNGEYFIVYDANPDTLDVSKGLFENWQVQVELSSQPTTYTSYNGQTVTIQFTDGSNPLTIYEGYVEMVNGVVMAKATYKYLDLSTITMGNNGTYWYSTSILSDAEDASNKYLQVTKIKSDSYKPVAPNQVANGTAIGVAYYAASLGGLMINSGDNTNAPTGNIIYPLATPLTFNLDEVSISSLQGQNNIFADTGNILEGKYFSKEV